LAAWPRSARAQQAGRTYRLGFLVPGGQNIPAVVAFFDELRLNGFIEGQNLTVVSGGFDIRNEQIAEAAAAMVIAGPDAIMAGPELQLRALQAATKTIPLIGMTEDMVASGLVASLARPGGNTTGISLLSPELDGKRLDILMEAVPMARRIAVMADSNVTSPRHLQILKDAARARGVELEVVGVARFEEVVPAITAAKASGAEAIDFLTGPLFGVPGTRNNSLVTARVKELHVPSIHQWPETAEDGGLIAYGARFDQIWRQRARITVKVLRRAKPAALPVEQPTHFELVINLQAAKAIGHEIPAGLVLRTNKVIE
jgi:putative ABC transport system substrate-binding protein